MSSPAAEDDGAQQTKRVDGGSLPPVPPFVRHDEEPPMTEAVKVEYCKNCGFPPDFCEFGSCWEKCRSQALRNPKLRPFYSHYLKSNADADIVVSNEEKETPKPDTPNNNPPPPASPNNPASPTPSPAPKLSKKSAKKEAPSVVTIQAVSRAKHKTATVVTGLDKFGIKLDAAAKIFKKHFACGSAAVKGLPGQHDHVEIQGDFKDTVEAVIIKSFPQIAAENISHLRPK